MELIDKMLENEALIPIVVLTAVFGVIIAAVVVIFFQKKPVAQDTPEGALTRDASGNPIVNTTTSKSHTVIQKTKTEKGKGKSNKETSISHPLLIASLKGHTGPVVSLDHSSCGKYLASTSEDRTVRIWKTKDFVQKDHRYSRVNVDLDHATHIGFSPDSKREIYSLPETIKPRDIRVRKKPLVFQPMKAFIVSLAVENTVRVFKMNKKKDASASGLILSAEFDFPKQHKGEILYAGVAVNGRFVMTISKDTKLIIWTLKGEVLATIDTLQVSNSHGAISPCGNLVASAGFTPDVKLWSVEFDKSSIFKQVTKVLELKGHSSGVYTFSFSSDSKRVATACKDGCWRIYDIDVDYKKGQESYLLATGNFSNCFGVSIDHALLSLSPDGYCIAIAVGKSIAQFNVFTRAMEEMLTDVHTGAISALEWLSSSHELVSAGGSDRAIRIWQNPTGAHALIGDLKSKLPKAKSDLIRERIQNQIREARNYLESIGYKD